jgi:hypothetical protein
MPSTTLRYWQEQPDCTIPGETPAAVVRIDGGATVDFAMAGVAELNNALPARGAEKLGIPSAVIRRNVKGR